MEAMQAGKTFWAGGLLAGKVELVERLKGDLAGPAATANAGMLPDTPAIAATRPIISTAAAAVSAPLLPVKPSASLPAARASAWASVSQVSTPKSTGRPRALPTPSMPAAAAWAM